MENPIKHHLQRERVVRRELSELLLRHHDDNVEIRLDALLRLYGMPSGLVAVRDSGLEAIVYQFNTHSNHGRNEVLSYIVRKDGVAAQRDRIDEDVPREEWLEEHRDELDWIRHDLRRELAD